MNTYPAPTSTTNITQTIFLMLNQEQEVYVASGEKRYSGTGRNRQETRHVGLISNYQIVPGGINVTNANGSSMRLVGKENILAPYWSAVGNISEFKLLLDRVRTETHHPNKNWTKNCRS